MSNHANFIRSIIDTVETSSALTTNTRKVLVDLLHELLALQPTPTHKVVTSTQHILYLTDQVMMQEIWGSLDLTKYISENDIWYRFDLGEDYQNVELLISVLEDMYDPDLIWDSHHRELIAILEELDVPTIKTIIYKENLND